MSTVILNVFIYLSHKTKPEINRNQTLLIIIQTETVKNYLDTNYYTITIGEITESFEEASDDELELSGATAI